MAQKNETLTLILALLLTGGIIGGGFWWFTRHSGLNLGNLPAESQNNPQNTQPNSTASDFPAPAEVPSGTVVRINGSTSMVQMNQELKESFEKQFPGTEVDYLARGSNQGIQELLAGKVDISAVSRPLSSQEQSQGLVAVPVARDAIAIMVGIKNPFRRSLSEAQVREIFQGKITDWAALGGKEGKIQVINRPSLSGTYQVFQELVLKGENFGTTSNITTMPQDATTPIIRSLGADGISYATFAQVVNQSQARVVPVEGLTPEAPNYPYQRTLYYVYKKPANPSVQAFLGHALQIKRE